MSTTSRIAKQLALSSAFSAALMLAAGADNPMLAKDQEECYGIAKKGENDCAANSHTCSGHAKVDYDGTEWKAVKRGTCTSIEVTLPDGKSRKGSLEPVTG